MIQLELAQLWSLFKMTWTAHDRRMMSYCEGHWSHRTTLPPPEQKWFIEFAKRWYYMHILASKMFTMDCEPSTTPLTLDEMIEMWAEGEIDD